MARESCSQFKRSNKAGPRPHGSRKPPDRPANPKQILYTKRRLLSLKLTFSDMFARACYAFGIKRTSLYVFNSFQSDASLTSLLLDEQAVAQLLLNTAGSLSSPAQSGDSVTRFEIRCCCRASVDPNHFKPRRALRTNPSTISTFLDELAKRLATKLQS